MGMSVLVTGGGGFIGSHLVEALLQRGASVRALDNLTTGHRANLADALARPEAQRTFTFIEGDVTDRNNGSGGDQRGRLRLASGRPPLCATLGRRSDDFQSSQRRWYVERSHGGPRGWGETGSLCLFLLGVW